MQACFFSGCEVLHGGELGPDEISFSVLKARRRSPRGRRPDKFLDFADPRPTHFFSVGKSLPEAAVHLRTVLRNLVEFLLFCKVFPLQNLSEEAMSFAWGLVSETAASLVRAIWDLERAIRDLLHCRRRAIDGRGGRAAAAAAAVAAAGEGAMAEENNSTYGTVAVAPVAEAGTRWTGTHCDVIFHIAAMIDGFFF